MADHSVDGDPLVHVPSQDVKVGTADPDVGDLQLDLPGPERPGVDLHDLDAPANDVLSSQHQLSLHAGPSGKWCSRTDSWRISALAPGTVGAR